MKSGEKYSKHKESEGFYTNLSLSVLAGEEGFELYLLVPKVAYLLVF